MLTWNWVLKSNQERERAKKINKQIRPSEKKLSRNKTFFFFGPSAKNFFEAPPPQPMRVVGISTLPLVKSRVRMRWGDGEPRKSHGQGWEPSRVSVAAGS
ncbi:hypothetical protein TNCT_1971 [Trichonephila clavata]|uniref:Uncharacterized protein n=1 Tax=Trichonephila clavata TaxID=2740835 RepID=A0A8X6JBE3_TRICU|nr:hypothetical protein TNCT_1971 [Trichonephila clavata]